MKTEAPVHLQSALFGDEGGNAVPKHDGIDLAFRKWKVRSIPLLAGPWDEN